MQSHYSYKSTAIVAILLGVILYFLSAFGQPHSDKLVEVIQSKIQKEIHLQNQYLTLVEQNFDLLASGEASNEFFPTFIFDKNKLVHWSTSKINLKLENLAGLDSMGIISIAVL